MEVHPGPGPRVREMLLTYHPQDDDLRRRLDPGYWHPAYDEMLAGCRLPLTPLGDFVEQITYGAIVTGRSPEPAPDGVPLLGQGTLRASGVDMAVAVRVAPDSPWTPARCRVRPGDLLIARSGAGSLEKNRLAVYHETQPAVVDCFVDLIRLAGIEPDYVAAFLRTRFGWAQIHRLINGVGPANLSFDEIRSLLIAEASESLQEQVARRHASEVLPVHRQREFDAASAAVRELVADVEQAIERGADDLSSEGR